MAAQDDGLKIQVDGDWKAQAQAEKERLSAKADQKPQAAGGGGAGRIPAASFETLLSTLATQALFAMGAIPDPSTGQRMQHLDLARHHIDMLGVVEEKTKGNLSEEETNLIATTIYELRSRYIQLSTAARRV